MRRACTHFAHAWWLCWVASEQTNVEGIPCYTAMWRMSTAEIPNRDSASGAPAPKLSAKIARLAIDRGKLAIERSVAVEGAGARSKWRREGSCSV